MKLLTWNLCSKPKPKEPPRLTTLKDAVTLLEMQATNDLVIGCLQETPLQGAELRTYVENESRRRLSCVPIHAKAQLVYSRDLRLIYAQRAKTKRAVVARLETPTHSRLDVVGLHCEDQGSLKPIAARGGAAALLRANLDELLDASLPAVVLGDFNAEPTSDEVCHERCFFGRTTFHHLVDRHEIATGVRRRPFFVKAPSDDRSYYYRAEERWTTMDFLMVSRELKDRVPSIAVLKRIADKSLLRGGAKRVPDQDISDHLPVLAELHFQ